MNILLPILVAVLAQDPAAPSNQAPAPVLEAPTPGNPHSTATDVLHAASEGTRDHAHAAVVAPLEAGQAALVEARQGNGTVLILGTRDGLEMVQGLGGQAGVRALDSVKTLPAQVDAASQDGKDSWAQWEVAQDGRNQRVKEASKASQAEQLEMVRQQRASAVEIGLERQQQHSWAGEQFSKRIPGDVADGVDTAKGVGAWSARETGDAWTGLQRRVPQLAVDVAQSTAASAHGGWQASADIFARATVSPWTVWQASGQAGASVAANLFPEAYRVVHGGGLLAAGLVAGTAAAQGVVVQEGGTALMDLSRWNWERGFVQGAQAGTTTARQAWKHDDPTMAVLWGTSGVAKAAWYPILAQPISASRLLLGLGGLGLEFLGRATNIPLHREWADFRAPETARALHTMQERGAPVDAGDIQLVRVNWWGDETGKTRFFITRHPVTGQRWYFERVVDTSTCGVSYRGTNEDPWLRRNAWKGTWETGLVDGVCQAGK